MRPHNKAASCRGVLSNSGSSRRFVYRTADAARSEVGCTPGGQPRELVQSSSENDKKDAALPLSAKRPFAEHLPGYDETQTNPAHCLPCHAFTASACHALPSVSSAFILRADHCFIFSASAGSSSMASQTLANRWLVASAGRNWPIASPSAPSCLSIARQTQRTKASQPSRVMTSRPSCWKKY